MKFWGAEVKPWTPLTVTPEEDSLIHISQATLVCKGKMREPVVLTVTVDKQKLVIGILSQEKFPQIRFDLFFEKEFKISHNCTKGSVHFTGYRSPNFEEVKEEEEVPVNGNAKAVKGDSKPKAKPVEEKPESDDDNNEEDESDDDDDSEKGMDVDEDDSDNDDSSSEKEETPKKPERINKKRPNKSASKKPVSGKKAKPAAAPPASPQRTEEKKKGGHTATPHTCSSGALSMLESERSFITTRYTSGSRADVRRMIRDGWIRA